MFERCRNPTVVLSMGLPYLETETETSCKKVVSGFRVLQFIENNWRTGHHSIQRIVCRSEASKGVYCLQYDDQKIISGLRDNTIKVSLFPVVAWLPILQSVSSKYCYGYL